MNPTLLSEDFWLFLDFPSVRSIFSTSVGGYKNTAIAEEREETQESSLISKEKVDKEARCCRSTVATCFALIGLAAWKHWFDSLVPESRDATAMCDARRPPDYSSNLCPPKTFAI